MRFVQVTDVFRPTWFRWAATGATCLVLAFVYAVAAAVVLRAAGVHATMLHGIAAVIAFAPFACVTRYEDARGSLAIVVAKLIASATWWIVGAAVWAAVLTHVLGELR